MDSWQDYVTLDAILPSVAWLIAMSVGIYGLWFPGITKSRRNALIGYILITLIVMVGYELYNVHSLRESRETTKKINTLLALAGVSSGDVNQGLDQLIKRNIQPRNIIPTQEEELSRAFELVKSSLPNPIHITYIINSPDWTNIAVPIQRALARNNVDGEFSTQRTSSPRQTGLMFTMPDPANPPDYALALRDAFGTAGIRDISFVKMSQEDLPLGFTIFVGPAPLQ
jgi:hypothetical protein